MTTRCGVAGSPIAHSLSPALHRAAYAHLRLDWEYDRHEVSEDGLGEFLDVLDDTWRGLSLTMPLKHEAVRLATDVSALAFEWAPRTPSSSRAGGGTRRTPTTRARGGPAGARRPERGPATVVGGGRHRGVGRGGLAGIAGRVDVVVRNPDRAGEVLRVADAVSLRCDVLPWSDADLALTAPLVVATTPKGGRCAVGVRAANPRSAL